MKTNYFKIVMPTVAILLAIGSSLATHASEKSTLVIKTGYISPIGGWPCSISTLCSSTGTSICTATYQAIKYQAYGKASQGDTVCEIFLFKL